MSARILREDPHAADPVNLCSHCRLEAWSRRADEECHVRLRAALDVANAVGKDFDFDAMKRPSEGTKES